MKTIIALVLVSLAATAHAGQPKITETAEGITVEYTGTASDKGDSSQAVQAAPLPGKPDTQTRQEFLTGRIEQLQKEIDDLTKLTGSESEAELAQKQDLADRKKAQLETLRAELARIEQKAAEKANPRDDQPNQQLRRQEMKKELRDMRQLRRDLMISPAR